MARKRQFNNETVLRAAANVFAQYGYTGASVDLLVSATGLQRGSIYQAYGSKAGLFRDCLLYAKQEILTSSSEDAGLYADLVVWAMLERTADDKKAAVLINEIITLLEQKLAADIGRIVWQRVQKKSNL